MANFKIIHRVVSPSQGIFDSKPGYTLVDVYHKEPRLLWFDKWEIIGGYKLHRELHKDAVFLDTIAEVRRYLVELGIEKNNSYVFFGSESGY